MIILLSWHKVDFLLTRLNFRVIIGVGNNVMEAESVLTNFPNRDISILVDCCLDSIIPQDSFGHRFFIFCFIDVFRNKLG